MLILTTTRSLLDINHVYREIEREIKLASKVIKRTDKVIKKIEQSR